MFSASTKTKCTALIYDIFVYSGLAKKGGRDLTLVFNYFVYLDEHVSKFEKWRILLVQSNSW